MLHVIYFHRYGFSTVQKGDSSLGCYRSHEDTYYYHTDHLGSSNVITDGAGNMVREIYYMPYGASNTVSGSIDVRHKFTGQELDDETGLYYYGARYYDPAIGRFISADTIVPNFADPQSLNRYSYVRNNPIIYTDPSGNHPVLFAMAAGAIIGGAQAAISGGDIVLGAFSGAFSGAVFYGAGSIIANMEAIAAMDSFYTLSSASISPLTQAAIHAGAGTISGAVSSSVVGGNPAMGGMFGGFSAGMGEYLGGGLIERSLAGGITGGIVSEMYGSNFGEGFVQGIKSAAYGYMFNHVWSNAFGHRQYHRHFNKQTGKWDEPNWGIRDEEGLAEHVLAPRGAAIAFDLAMKKAGYYYTQALSLGVGCLFSVGTGSARLGYNIYDFLSNTLSVIAGEPAGYIIPIDYINVPEVNGH